MKNRIVSTVRWGAATNTDDLEGEVIEHSTSRPSRSDIEALLPSFTGVVEQVPPAFSAIKIDGKRAYAEARAGREVQLDARRVDIDRFDLIDCPDSDHAIFEIDCGKGTYVRSLARDLGKQIGCYGHIVELRRTFVEPFDEQDAVPLQALIDLEGDLDALDQHLVSSFHAMQGFPELRIDQDQARRLRLGNPIILRGRDAPIDDQDVCAVYRGALVAIGDIRQGSFHPRRVLRCRRLTIFAMM